MGFPDVYFVPIPIAPYDWQSYLTFIGILVAVFVFVGDRFFERKKQRAENQERMQRCIQTIEQEIQDHKDGLDPSNESFIIVEENPSYSYRNIKFVYDGYESLLNSGLFTYFQTQTQNRLTNLYARIKTHNTVIEERDLVRTHFFMDGDYSEERIAKWKKHILAHDVVLSRYQNEIQELLIDVKRLIDDEEKIRLR